MYVSAIVCVSQIMRSSNSLMHHLGSSINKLGRHNFLVEKNLMYSFSLHTVFHIV